MYLNEQLQNIKAKDIDKLIHFLLRFMHLYIFQKLWIYKVALQESGQQLML